jgi:hypothetical protein
VSTLTGLYQFFKCNMCNLGIHETHLKLSVHQSASSLKFIAYRNLTAQEPDSHTRKSSQFAVTVVEVVNIK